MGATAWSYFAPYQPDIGAVLKELRQSVFERGDYERPGELVAEYMRTEERQQKAARFARLFGEKFAEQMRRIDDTPVRDPGSIEELIEQCGESGTHSILDIDRIAAAPEPGAAAPLPAERLKELLGADRPTRPMLEQAERAGQLACRRGHAHYLLVYAEDEPTEIYFWGSTGD